MIACKSIFCTDESFGRAWEFWIGTALVTGLLELIHFFAPINFWVSLVIIGLGFIVYLARLMPHWNRALLFSKEEWITGALILPMILWGVGKMFQEPANYDSGLYHFPTIRWINELAVVPGLANIHGRLGFNTSSFLLVALFNFFPFLKIGHLVIGPLFFLVFFSQLCSGFIRSFMSCERGLLGALGWGVLMYIYTDRKNETGMSPSPAPDSILMVLDGVLSLAILRTRELTDKRVWLWGVLPLLGSLAVTAKLSSLILVLAFGLYCLIVYGKLIIWPQASKSWSLLIPAVISMVVWIAHGYVLTGYPLFPLGIGRLPFDWAVPHENAANECNAVVYWAQSVFGSIPYPPYTSNWFHLYLPFLLKKHILFCITLSLASVWLLIYFAVVIGNRSLRDPADYLLPFPFLIQLVCWFFQAPDPRFLGGNSYLLATLSLGLLIVALSSVVSAKFRTVGLIISGSAALYAICWSWVAAFSITFHGVVANKFIHLGTPPVISYREFHLDDRHTIYMPQGTDQAWDGAFPTMPYGNSHFVLRGDSWQSGFKPKKE